MSRHTNRGQIFLTEGKYDVLRCKGEVRVDSNVSAVSVNIKGSLITDNDITADEEFDFKGRISARNIKASDVKILTDHDGKAGTITGRSVNIRCGIDPAMKEEFANIVGSILRLLHVDDTEIRNAAEKAESEKKEDSVFLCDEISGDDIELYGVTCRRVSGRNIDLKGNCRIDRVTYSGNFTADDSCVVGKAEKA